MRQELTLRGNHALLTRANPLAKFAAVTLITLVLALSIDWVSASVALAFELALLPLAGLTLGAALAARLAADPRRGAGRLEHHDPGAGRRSHPARRRDLVHQRRVPQLGLGFMLRGLAIALPAVLLMSCTDPTDLADALAQKAKLPHRFVLGTLAAMRLVGLMAEEWQTIGMARRARGRGLAAATRCSGCGPPWGRASGCWCRRSGVPPGWRSPWKPGASAARHRTWARPSTSSAAWTPGWCWAASLIAGGRRRRGRGSGDLEHASSSSRRAVALGYRMVRVFWCDIDAIPAGIARAL